MKQDSQILLFYKYVKITDPALLLAEQNELCKSLNLLGRMIVAEEGINGTLEGSVADTEKYVEIMQRDERFADIDFKRSEGTGGKAFPKLSIKVRQEIVSGSFGEHDVDPSQTTGKYITAEELHDWIVEGKKEFYIVDMRNDYEHKVGYFENSVLAPLKNFRDLPEKLEELEYLKGKTVVTVCTGGVRCEKASGVLIKNGFADVYQLKNGIHTYMEKYPNQHFKGKLYVFDRRVTMGFNLDSEEHEVVGHCDKCGSSSDNYVDCAYLHCKSHRHIVCCENCLEDKEKNIAYCTEECKLADLATGLSSGTSGEVLAVL